jgi:hypothetical protein
VPRQPDDVGLKGLGQRIASLHEARGRRREALAAARAAFIDEAVFAETRRFSRAGIVRAAVGLVVLFALVGAAFVIWHGKRWRPPSFVANAAVSGQAVAVTVGRWLSAPEMEDVILSFSDGSRFTLRAGARARLSALSRVGGRLTLERGEIQGQVATKDATWTVQAGPLDFAFSEGAASVVWDPAVDRVALEVTQGRVVVSGACVGREPATYVQGMHPFFDCPDAGL